MYPATSDYFRIVLFDYHWTLSRFQRDSSSMRSFQLLNMFSLDILSPPGDIDVCSRGDEVWTADGSKSELRVCWSALQSRVVWSEDNGLKG